MTPSLLSSSLHVCPAVEDVQNVQIVCVWCQKEGVKRYSLCMGSDLKSFCSEKCFAACRRAYFKRNKVSCEQTAVDHQEVHLAVFLPWRHAMIGPLVYQPFTQLYVHHCHLLAGVCALHFLFFFFLLYLINHSQRVEAPALVHTLRLYKGHTHVHTGTVCKLIPAVSFTRDRGAKHQVVPGR